MAQDTPSAAEHRREQIRDSIRRADPNLAALGDALRATFGPGVRMTGVDVPDPDRPSERIRLGVLAQPTGVLAQPTGEGGAMTALSAADITWLRGLAQCDAPVPERVVDPDRVSRLRCAGLLERRWTGSEWVVLLSRTGRQRQAEWSTWEEGQR